jgi:methylated-DNA-protein-cysteine methyltransferase-like protein
VEREEAIEAAVCKVPRGRVATYGEIAFEAGFPRHARQVGQVLSQLEPDSGVPWHRVINAKGEISPRGDGCVDEHRRRLEAEGVEFKANGRIDLRRFGWLPSIQTPRR